MCVKDIFARHSLYKYYTERKWGEAFLNGELLFRSLSYFRDLEDGTSGEMGTKAPRFTVRTMVWLLQTTPKAGRKSSGAHLSPPRTKRRFLFFCLSRSLADTLRDGFNAAVCIEVLDVKDFCARIEAALPSDATFPGKPGRTRIGQRVEYYKETDDCNPRWALPDLIAAAKQYSYFWQDDYRLVFSLTDALGFEKTDMRLVPDGGDDPQKIAEHRQYLLKARTLRDIGTLHNFENSK
jgi:hypothetical protein